MEVLPRVAGISKAINYPIIIATAFPVAIGTLASGSSVTNEHSPLSMFAKCEAALYSYKMQSHYHSTTCNSEFF